MDEEDQLTILFEFQGSRKELSIFPCDICNRLEEELRQMGIGGAIVTLDDKIRESPEHYFIQRWCIKWNNFVNINHVEQIKEYDKITVVPNIQNSTEVR